MDWKLFATTFVTLFIAELGDKTQLACIMLAAESRKPWTVFLASSLALVLVSLLGVLLAAFICRWISPEIIKRVAGAGFVVLGALIFFGKL
ncbi:MAG: hypothetical protein D6E12_02805 [Desulfovibrio sp.]|nr:MAG: hypothetical protein D6E12_02805 [Desulfovibrio sp.]